MKLKIKRLTKTAQLPSYANPSDAGLDLVADESAVLRPGDRQLIKTGIAIELPEGYEAQIRPRSGLAIKHGISLVNTPGTIDAGYRGEIAVIVINHGQSDFEIEQGMRIAQMVISEYTTANIEEVDELGNSDRGEAGFGSTGTR